jgi:hypothetical protein
MSIKDKIVFVFKVVVRYFYNILVSFVAQGLNVILCGDPDESICSRVGKFLTKYPKPRHKLDLIWYLATAEKYVSGFIFRSKNHVYVSQEHDEGSENVISYAKELLNEKRDERYMVDVVENISVTLQTLGIKELIFNGLLRIFLISFGAYAIQAIFGRILGLVNSDRGKNLIALFAMCVLSWVVILFLDYSHILVEGDDIILRNITKAQILLGYLFSSVFHFLFSIIFYMLIWKLYPIWIFILSKIVKKNVDEISVGDVKKIVKQVKTKK